VTHPLKIAVLEHASRGLSAIAELLVSVHSHVDDRLLLSGVLFSLLERCAD